MTHKDKVVSGLINECDLSRIREAVCIQVEKIYDSCREKDCVEDAKVNFKNPECIQKIINAAINVKIRRAEIIDVFIDIEPVPFKRGFFTVDVKFFIRVFLDFFVPTGSNPARPIVIPVKGVVTFDKKVILFGSEGNVKIFKSHFEQNKNDVQIKTALQQDNNPIGKVEVADPIGLNAKIEDIRDKCFEDCSCDLPRHITDMLEDDIEQRIESFELPSDERFHHHRKRVVATIGIFSIIKLARFVQLLIPAFDFCFPNKECIASTEENPCELFETIEFPFNEFFPPQKFDFPGANETEERMRGQFEHEHAE
jgi:hypothetical protein